MEHDYKQELKVTVGKRRPMSDDALRKFSPRIRMYIHKFVYPMITSTTLPVEILRSDKAIGSWFCENYENGHYLLYGYTKGKTRSGVKRYCWLHIDIFDNENNKFQIAHKRGRLNRYWFRRKSKGGI